MSIKQAVVMVGGKGTRLAPLTNTTPKIILPVADKPCLWYLLKSMADAGIKEVILACGYKSELVEDAIGNGLDLGMQIDYSYEKEPLGTGGAMKLVEDRLDDTILAANGDVFAFTNVSKQIETHEKTGADVTIALTRVNNPCEYGIARVMEDGRILEFKDKPKPEEVFSNFINAGTYVVKSRVLEKIPENAFYDFSKDLIPKIIREGSKVYGHEIEGIWMDVGRPKDLLGANLTIAEKEYTQKDWNSPGCRLNGRIYIGDRSLARDCALTDVALMRDTTVLSSSLNRVLALENCNIRNATLTNVILGRNCTVEEGATVSNAVLPDDTIVKSGTNIDEKQVV